MALLNKLKQHLKKSLGFGLLKETDPKTAYNLWSQSYDYQPGNLVLALDEEVFFALLNSVSINNKLIADVGCGTGRHWKKLLEMHPSSIIGFDVAEDMLKKLQENYRGAKTHLIKDGSPLQLQSSTINLLISTLALAHIQNIEQTLNEWHRVVKKGGDIIITDYHPEILAKGGNRTFDYNGRLIAIKNYIHPLSVIRKIAINLNLKEVNFIERNIDEAVKHYYEKQNAMHVFEKFKGTPVIYGIHLKKQHDIV